MSSFKLNEHFITTIVSSSSENDGCVNFCNYGGGFVHRLAKDLFEAQAEAVDDLPNEIIAGFVKIDVYMPAKAYYNPHSRWNGWAKPMFEPKELLALLKDMIDDDDDYIKFTSTDTSIIYTHFEDDDLEVSEFFNIEYNGNITQVVEPPSGWCWDIINPNQASKYYAENLKQTLGKNEAIKQAIIKVFGECDESNKAIKVIFDELRECINFD